MSTQYYTITGDRLTINIATLSINEVELILPDDRRITYGITDRRNTPQLTKDDLRLLIPAFITQRQTENNLLETTITDYRRRLGAFADWLPGDTVNDGDWVSYYQCIRANLKPVTARNYYRNLSVFADWLTQTGKIPANPLKNIKPPKPDKNAPPKAISAHDIRLMIKAADTLRDKAILLFFWDSGCRATEAARLTWGDIQLSEGVAGLTGKGNKHREAFFTPEITGEVMARYRETVSHRAADPVFVGKRGALTYDGLYRVFERVAEAAGIPDSKHNPHAWRHAFGRDTTLSGMPTGVLQKLMGHSSIETTKIYLGFANQDLQNQHRKHTPVRNFDSISQVIVQSS